MTRIELAYPAWEAGVLPLNYARISPYNSSIYTHFKAVVKRKIHPPAVIEWSGQVCLECALSGLFVEDIGQDW